MSNLIFSAGICPPSNKEAIRGKPVKQAPIPKRMIFLLSQSAGQPAVPIVRRNEKVLIGQKIADSGLSSIGGTAPLHSSVSGKVVEVGIFDHPARKTKSPAIIIDNDGKENYYSSGKTYGDYYRYTPDELRSVIYEAGILGLGGSGFPTAFKISSRHEINILIANGCESEPYIGADEALMTERPKEVIEGMKIVMYILNLYKGIVAVQEEEKNAAGEIKKVIFKEPNITLKQLKGRYPQSAERMLIKTLLGKEIPRERFPVQDGILVLNVATCFAIYEAVVKGVPLYRRVVTVSGDLVRDCGNYEVRIGTPASNLLKECGYSQDNNDMPHKIIFGGPLEGRSQHSADVPVIKTTRGILAIKTVKPRMSRPCIRCAKCVDVCPSKILPNMLSVYAEAGLWENAKEYSPMDCIECGCCSYVCVSSRPVLQHVLLVKERLKC